MRYNGRMTTVAENDEGAMLVAENGFPSVILTAPVVESDEDGWVLDGEA